MMIYEASVCWDAKKANETNLGAFRSAEKKNGSRVKQTNAEKRK
jgi:hypothetical protein